MILNPAIMEAVEQLGDRITVGDVATYAGLNINLAQQELLILATNVGAHMQVTELGEIVYLFPKDLRAILRNKFWRLRLQEWWGKIWRVLFFLIRLSLIEKPQKTLSFGVFLLGSITLISIVLLVITTGTMFAASDSNNSVDIDSDDGWWIRILDSLIDLFSSESKEQKKKRRQRERDKAEESQSKFSESVFSFLFGDGNPNADLEERRYKEIAAIISSNKGVIVAEQITPYLDNIGSGFAQEYEDYMLPVLIRFNGQPIVSPEGHIVYVFPDLQFSTTEQRVLSSSSYLQELPEQFSAANLGDTVLSIGLGILNLGGAVYLGSLLPDKSFSFTAITDGSTVDLFLGIYWVLLGYAGAFLTIPLVRFFILLWNNAKIKHRNSQRQQRILQVAEDTVKQKIAYARSFATHNAIAL